MLATVGTEVTEGLKDGCCVVGSSDGLNVRDGNTVGIREGLDETEGEAVGLPGRGTG